MLHLRLAPLVLGALALSAGVASAQGAHTFVVDTPASAFTYTGTVQIPPAGPASIQGIPNNMFNMTGSLCANVTTTAGVPTSAQFIKGGTVTTVPEIQAELPNPIPFLPPLAMLKVTGLQVAIFSTDALGTPASFTVGAGGSFNTNVVAEIVSGTADVTAPILGTQIIDLAGEQSPRQAISGTLTAGGGGFQVSVPLNLSFTFTDPGTGATGTLNLMGTVNADYEALNSDVQTLSVSAGGTQNLYLSTGGVLPGNPYVVLGSVSGTAPGTPVGSVLVPLNADAFTFFMLDSLNLPPFQNTLGTLDADGKAQAAVVLPPNQPPSLAGLNINFAYIVLNLAAGGTVDFASNAEPLNLAP